MTSYHGWTHRPKSMGGTDPIGLESGWVTDYCYMAQILDQNDPAEPNTHYNPIDLGPITEGFTSNEDVLWPDFNEGKIVLNPESEGEDPGQDSNPGLYIASFDVDGWDNYSGGTTEVLDAVKGCAVVWIAPTLDQRNAVHTLKPPSGTADTSDADTTVFSMNVVQFNTSNHHVYGSLFQYSAVDAQYVQATLWVARLAAYEYRFLTNPTWGKWYP